MRILFLAPYLPYPPDHGGRIRSLAFLRALCGEHEVHLLAPEGGGGEERRAAALGKIAARVETLPGSPPRSRSAKAFRWLRSRSDLAERRWHPAAAARVRQAASSDRWDLLLADSTWSLPPLAGVPPPPLLVNFQNVESSVLSRPRARREPWTARVSSAIEARLLGSLERRAASRARLSIVASEEDQSRLLRLAPGAAVEVVPNSVDLDRLPLLPPADLNSPLLLFVGSLDYPPNLEAARSLLLEHLPVLRGRRPDLRCRILGADSSGEVAALARRAGAEAVGFVPELRSHYAEATCLYAPIASGGGSRLKVLEAFALGRPVLTTSVGAEGLPVRPGEHYLPIDRPEAGAAALERLLAGGGAPLVAAGRRLVEARFSHREAARSLLDLVRTRFGANSGS